MGGRIAPDWRAAHGLALVGFERRKPRFEFPQELLHPDGDCHCSNASVVTKSGERRTKHDVARGSDGSWKVAADIGARRGVARRGSAGPPLACSLARACSLATTRSFHLALISGIDGVKRPTVGLGAVNKV